MPHGWKVACFLKGFFTRLHAYSKMLKNEIRTRRTTLLLERSISRKSLSVYLSKRWVLWKMRLLAVEWWLITFHRLCYHYLTSWENFMTITKGVSLSLVRINFLIGWVDLEIDGTDQHDVDDVGEDFIRTYSCNLFYREWIGKMGSQGVRVGTIHGCRSLTGSSPSGKEHIRKITALMV